MESNNSMVDATNKTSIYFMEKIENPNVSDCRPTILMTELQVITA